MNEDGAARCPEGEGMMGGPREWEEREEGGGRNEEGMVCVIMSTFLFSCVLLAHVRSWVARAIRTFFVRAQLDVA